MLDLDKNLIDLIHLQEIEAKLENNRNSDKKRQIPALRTEKRKIDENLKNTKKKTYIAITDAKTDLQKITEKFEIELEDKDPEKVRICDMYRQLEEDFIISKEKNQLLNKIDRDRTIRNDELVSGQFEGSELRRIQMMRDQHEIIREDIEHVLSKQKDRLNGHEDKVKQLKRELHAENLAFLHKEKVIEELERVSQEVRNAIKKQ